jgi:type II secretory pathway component PulJ
MGSQTVLDLIGSSLIFGLLLLMVIRVNGASGESLQSYRADLLVQQNLVMLVGLLEYDFRKIGYCKNPNKLPDPTKYIRYADSIKIRFYTDVDNDGNVDSLSYYVGPTSEATYSPNPNDRLFYRVVNNNTPRGVNFGITVFDLQYYDALKNKLTFPITQPALIQTMQITIQIENLAATTLLMNRGTLDLRNQYQTAYWRQVRLVAKNLRNR